MAFRLREYHHPDFTQEQFRNAPDTALLPAPKEGVVPEHYHSTTIFPEYFKINGEWHLAEESRMDCCAVWKDGRVQVIEFRNIHKGDLVVVGRKEDGSEGIYVWPDGFEEEKEGHKDLFAFRQGRSRETAFSKDYDDLYELLDYERDHGYIVWVMGPACAFDADSRRAFGNLVNEGYVDALLAGNALATHDLEGAYLGTALGQDIYTQESMPLGHYNHLDTLNRIRYYGSIPSFIEHEHIDNGIMYNCVKNNVPFVLAGSIRDDGPQPEIYGNVYDAQNAMRDQVRKATTVICMATMLHSIAVGNMTPSFRVMPDGTIRQLYFYVVDISEFTVNKLADRGSIAARSIVTNAQDFVVNVYKGVHELAEKKDKEHGR
ncbi:MAG: hypothetical protein VZT48_04210 [Bulleidia sp.]|nr:hypothetical protein [Bulleidia sp.]